MKAKKMSDEQLRRGTEEVIRLQAFIRGTIHHLRDGTDFNFVDRDTTQGKARRGKNGGNGNGHTP